MAVSYCKKMSSAILTKMRKNQERVLISFIRIFWRVSRFSSKRKFCNAVIKLFTSLSRLDGASILLSCRSNLLGYRSSYIMAYLFTLYGSSIFRLSLSLLWWIHHELALVINGLFDVFPLNRLTICILNYLLLGLCILNSSLAQVLGLTTSWWLPSASISVIAASGVEFLLRSLLRCQWSQMWLLHFSIILFNLRIGLNCIKLCFLLIFAAIWVNFKVVVAVKELLIHLLGLVVTKVVRLLILLVVALTSSFYGAVVAGCRKIYARAWSLIIRISLISWRIDYLWKISLSSYLLIGIIQLILIRLHLLLSILWKFIERTAWSSKDLGLAWGLIRVLLGVVHSLLELSLLIAVVGDGAVIV